LKIILNYEMNYILKIQNWLIYLFLFLLPWQTRLILRHGVLNEGSWEYGIVGIYTAEILLWLIFLLHFYLKIRSYILVKKDSSTGYCYELFYFIQDKFRQAVRNDSFWFVLFFIFLLARAFISFDWLVGLQQFWHLFEAGMILWILKNNIRSSNSCHSDGVDDSLGCHSERNEPKANVVEESLNKINIAFWFIFGLLFQAGFGIWQFLAQETFASRFFGLTLHEAAIGGSSVVENFGGRWLRAYGGLPHPNVFGGFMLAGIVLILFSRILFEKQWQKIFFNSALPILTAALFFSFSRSAWLGLIAAILVFLVFKKPRFQEKSVGLIFSIILIVILSFIFKPILAGRVSGTGRLEAQSTTERLSGYAEAMKLFKKNYFWGVGLGNYTLAAYNLHPGRPAWDYQPVHNAFVLALVELGAVGFLFLFFIAKNLIWRASAHSRARFHFNTILHNPFLLAFLPALLLDHYFWSLWAGAALSAVILFFYWISFQADI